MSATPVSVIGAGLVSAVGFNGPASWAAIRSRISGLRVQKLFDMHSGEALCGGRVPLPQWWEGIGKLADLLAPAVFECLLAAERSGLARASLAEVPLFVTSSEPGCDHRLEGIETELLAELELRLGPMHRFSSFGFGGRCGAVEAIQAAAELFAAGRSRCCIVAGVDSLLHREAVLEIIERQRVITPDNSNGFFPGEAAAAVLLAPSGAHPLGELRLLGLGFGQESGTIESDEPLRGEGLCAAIRQAFAPAGMTMLDVHYRLTDINGERYKFMEAALSMARLDRKVDALGRRAPDDRIVELWNPIEYLGEIGAAIVPCLLGLAFDAGRRGWAPGPVALCHVGDDGGQRAAILAKSIPGRAASNFMGRTIRER